MDLADLDSSTDAQCLDGEERVAMWELGNTMPIHLDLKLWMYFDFSDYSSDPSFQTFYPISPRFDVENS